MNQYHMERYIGQGMEKGHRASMASPATPTPCSLHILINPEALQNPIL